jgi:hypothetical protein
LPVRYDAAARAAATINSIVSALPRLHSQARVPVLPNNEVTSRIHLDATPDCFILLAPFLLIEKTAARDAGVTIIEATATESP